MNRISLLFLILYSFLLPAGPSIAANKEQFEEALDAARQRDYEYALESWETLAKKGHADSQYRLGVMYRLGTGVEKDLEKAFQWFQRAAEQGHPQAQYNLGMMYLKGWGVDRNLEEAEKWFSQAAAQDVELAKKRLTQRLGDSLSTIAPDIMTPKKDKEPVDINDLLRWAASEGRTAGVRDLLKLGAEVNSLDKHDRSALMEAAYFGHSDTVKALLEM
ncbi:MAG: tetratricopeptide repeat protein, partial [Gammaproteobacteria bacterium]